MQFSYGKRDMDYNIIQTKGDIPEALADVSQMSVPRQISVEVYT